MFGLKQASCAWKKHQAEKVQAAGRTQSLAGPSLWTLLNPDLNVIPAHADCVDDLLVASS